MQQSNERSVGYSVRLFSKENNTRDKEEGCIIELSLECTPRGSSTKANKKELENQAAALFSDASNQVIFRSITDKGRVLSKRRGSQKYTAAAELKPVFSAQTACVFSVEAFSQLKLNKLLQEKTEKGKAELCTD